MRSGCAWCKDRASREGFSGQTGTQAKGRPRAATGSVQDPWRRLSCSLGYCHSTKPGAHEVLASTHWCMEGHVGATWGQDCTQLGHQAVESALAAPSSR